MIAVALTVSTETAWAAAVALLVAGVVVGLAIPAVLGWLDNVRLAVADMMYAAAPWVAAAAVVIVALLATGRIRL